VSREAKRPYLLWGTVVLSAEYRDQDVEVTAHLHLEARLRTSGAKNLLPL
jgi:hypothetical protein